MLKRKTFEVSTAMLVLDEILHDLYASYFNQLPKNVRHTLEKLIRQVADELDRGYPKEDTITDILIREISYEKK